jgi:hypothetical protein
MCNWIIDSLSPVQLVWTSAARTTLAMLILPPVRHFAGDSGQMCGS